MLPPDPGGLKELEVGIGNGEAMEPPPALCDGLPGNGPDADVISRFPLRHPRGEVILDGISQQDHAPGKEAGTASHVFEQDFANGLPVRGPGKGGDGGCPDDGPLQLLVEFAQMNPRLGCRSVQRKHLPVSKGELPHGGRT